jgi:hypothetical protein
MPSPEMRPVKTHRYTAISPRHFEVDCYLLPRSGRAVYFFWTAKRLESGTDQVPRREPQRVDLPWRATDQVCGIRTLQRLSSRTRFPVLAIIHCMKFGYLALPTFYRIKLHHSIAVVTKLYISDQPVIAALPVR